MRNIIIVIYTIVGVTGMTLIKAGAKNTPGFHLSGLSFSLEASWVTLCGVLFYGISFLLYTYLLSKYDLSLLFPILTAMTCIGVFFVSTVIFHEPITATKIVGTALILTGLFFLNVK